MLCSQDREVAARAGNGRYTVGSELGFTPCDLRRARSQPEQDVAGARLFPLEERFVATDLLSRALRSTSSTGSVRRNREVSTSR